MLISRKLEVVETSSLCQVKEALIETLKVPNENLKPKIIREYLNYLKLKSENKEYKIKTFVTLEDDIPIAMATCHVHPSYTSYGRKCGTIGWLLAQDFNSIQKLIAECETFFLERKIRKVRCGINFPKSLGGLGFQVSGFKEPILYGVGFFALERQEINYLQQLGYIIESEYTCLKVSAKTWQKAEKLNKNIRFEYIPISEMKNRSEEVQNLAKESFQGLLPDTSGGRFPEFINAFEQMPPSKEIFQEDINPRKISSNKVFLEAWESCDLENITPLMPIAYDKTTGQMVGVLLGLPDLYQHWVGKKITRVNVDTAIVHKDYKGQGIFSALNNIGQITCGFYGMNYFEGTTVWTGNSRGVNNIDAINSIMPHCIPIRKHIILQKKIKGIKRN